MICVRSRIKQDAPNPVVDQSISGQVSSCFGLQPLTRTRGRVHWLGHTREVVAVFNLSAMLFKILLEKHGTAAEVIPCEHFTHCCCGADRESHGTLFGETQASEPCHLGWYGRLGSYRKRSYDRLTVKMLEADEMRGAWGAHRQD